MPLGEREFLQESHLEMGVSNVSGAKHSARLTVGSQGILDERMNERTEAVLMRLER